MKTSLYRHALSALGLAVLIGSSANLEAQTATWNNVAADNDWNNGLNWDIGTPLEGTNVIIGAAFTINYNGRGGRWSSRRRARPKR